MKEKKSEAGALARENGSAGNDRKREKAGAPPFFLSPSQRSPRASVFPSSQPPRAFSQVCSQGATVGGLCGGERGRAA